MVVTICGDWYHWMCVWELRPTLRNTSNDTAFAAMLNALRKRGEKGPKSAKKKGREKAK